MNYANSHALIIGIDKYQSASPLGYAVNDAQSVRQKIMDKFEFKSENIHYLINEEATRESIFRAYLGFTQDGTSDQDRIFFFFAGHGHTLTSHKNEVGYLVPVDGDTSDLYTLIRWDDLTKQTDLINAKHILFVMDACYGGLALTRSGQPGSTRFLKDMLQRRARQVITAGKADELVADLGGPLPNHSIFTGHFLEGLDGKALNSNGILSASGIMSYVYTNVGQDPDSQQTPHFGYLDGDGDMIFQALEVEADEEGKETDTRLMRVPPTPREKE